MAIDGIKISENNDCTIGKDPEEGKKTVEKRSSQTHGTHVSENSSKQKNRERKSSLEEAQKDI